MALVEVEQRDVVVGDRDAQEAQAALRGELVGGGEQGRAHAGALVVGVDREKHDRELASADGEREQADELAVGVGDEVHAGEHVEGPAEHVDVGLAERALAQQRDRFVVGVARPGGRSNSTVSRSMCDAQVTVMRASPSGRSLPHVGQRYCGNGSSNASFIIGTPLGVPCIRRFCYTATAPLPRESRPANGENPRVTHAAASRCRRGDDDGSGIIGL